MKVDVALKWFDALDNSKYTKIKGKLRTKNGFCPYGVLCDISNLSSWIEEKDHFTYLNQEYYLPKQVCEWAGINSYEKNILTGYIFAYNDSTNLSLKEISTILREKFKK